MTTMRDLMRLTESGTAVTFRIEMHGAYDGQQDFTLLAQRAGKPVGGIDFSLYQGEVAIQHIEVAEPARRQGVAKAMLRHLQAAYPGSEIDWGMLTDDGAKLYAHVPMDDIDNPAMRRRIDLLPRLRAKLNAVEARMNAIIAQGTPLNPQQHAALAPLSDMMNRLHDMIDKLAWQTHGKRPTKRLIRTDDADRDA